eukprot:c52439_g1_i1 orf=31-183(+)
MSINDYYMKHFLIMHFVGRIPPDTILQSWINRQWVGRGLEVANIQYLTKG